MTETALYYPDGTSATRAEIRRKLLAEELTVPSHLTPRPQQRDFTEWQPIMARRQDEYKELLQIPETVRIEIATDKPILICPIGDVHALHPECNLTKFGQDIDLVKSANGYFMTFGDLTDSIFWKQIPGLASNEESVLYMRSALKYMAEDGHLLCGFLGDHDSWQYDKHGGHTLYHEFWEKFNAHLLDGVSYVDLTLNDGETEVSYPFIGSHRHKGFSVYNDAHAAWRQQLDEANTSRSIVSITAHKHTKAHLTQTRKCFGGNERLIHALSLGTYKESDRHSRKHGWPRKGEETASAFGIVLHPGKDQVNVYWNLEQAIESMA